MKTNLIPDKFIKNKDKAKRVHKVTSINLDYYQYETLKELNIDVSGLVRSLLDQYLSVNAPDEYFKNKKRG